MGKARIDVPRSKIEAFCRKWKVKEFFRPDSDVDVLVVFEEDAGWDLWDIVEMRDELKDLFGREVDLVEKRALRNPFRKYEILKTHEVIYAS